MKLATGDSRELGLRVVDIIDLDTVDIQVFETAADLIKEIARRHAVAACNHVRKVSDSRVSKGFIKIATDLFGRGVIKGDKASLFP